MDIDKKTILGLLLIGLVIMVTYSDFYRKWVMGDKQQPTIENYETASSPAVQGADSVRRIDEGQKAELSEQAGGAEKRKALTENIVSDFQITVSKAEEKRLTIETPLLTAILSTKGPSIESWVLKNYLGPDSLPVQLINNPQGNLCLGLPIDRDTLNLAEFVFEEKNEKRVYKLDESNPIATIRLDLDLGEGRSVEQDLIFEYDKYSFGMCVRLNGLERVVDGFTYIVNLNMGLKSTEKSLAEDMQYTQAFALTPNDLVEFDIGKKKEEELKQNDWNINWGALRTKYFTAALIPTTNNSNGIRFFGQTRPVQEGVLLKEYQIGLGMPYKRSATSDSFYVYLGPLQYSIVKSYGANLERMMNFGWRIIRPISKFVLWSLTRMYQLIPNYGLVIVIFSILIKIVLYPLTKKSYQSMKEMQAVQPRLAELRDKYGKDPQKLNAETMKLYKEHGVNPMGGCLPTLLQMPLLYALFIVFRTTIELRGAPFFGWIKDLSAADTVYTLPFTIPFYGDGVNILPLVMGATMFWQQKATITDQKQKALLYMMPIMFTVLFNSFPSGLTLYYTLFNVFSVIQQKWIPEHHALEGPQNVKRKSLSRMDILRKRARGQ